MSIVNVIGLGYIGLPTALILSSRGVRVVGTDCDNGKVDSLLNGKLTFEERGLDELYNKALENKIKFTDKVVKADTYIIAVPTPYIKENKKIDPKFVMVAINDILDVWEEEITIVIESTISPGSIDKYVRHEIKKRGLIIGQDVHLVHAPERIIPGNMIHELENNSRTIGADDLGIAEKVKKIYSSFCKGEIVITDIKTAEMSKIIENTYRDVNIAFANELAKICRYDDIDVYEVIRIANKHPRVNILQPGPGVGGHCISVDPWFLIGDYTELTNVILAARETNDTMPKYVLDRIIDIMKDNKIKDMSRIGLYGLTYKENVDDTRESPTLQLLKLIEDNFGFRAKVYDPYVKNKIVEQQFMDFKHFIDETDMLVIMVAHNHLKENINSISEKIILDTRNVCNHKNVYKL